MSNVKVVASMQKHDYESDGVVDKKALGSSKKKKESKIPQPCILDMKIKYFWYKSKQPTTKASFRRFVIP